MKLSSLDAKIILNVNEETGKILENLDLSEIFICSEVVLNIKSNKNKDDICARNDYGFFDKFLFNLVF